MKIKTLDFIVIGAPKAGTTTLFHYLRHHPHIYIPPEKEVPFFANDEWFHRGWEWFAREFFAHASEDTLWGTITPHYMGYPRVPERIYKLMPKVKLVAILRNPIDRAFSHYRMKVRSGREQRSFEEVVNEQLKTESILEARALTLNPTTVSYSYLVRSEYCRILRYYLSYFPLEKFLVLFTDELEQNPQIVLDSIFTFLGLESGFSPPNLGRRYHIGGTRQRFPGLIPIAQKIYPLKWLWKILPKAYRKTILFQFNTQINIIPEAPSQLPSVLCKKLIEFYRPDVLELEGLIGREVPWKDFHEESSTSSIV